MGHRSLFVAALAMSAACAAPAVAADSASVSRSLLVPGQDGTVPPGPHSTDQLDLVDRLVPLAGDVTAADVEQLVKPAPLQSTPAGPGTTPRAGVRIVRDAFGVPQVYGKTAFAVAFGAGWATAEDRSLFLEAIRGPGRLAALDAPGIDPVDLAASLRTFTPSRSTERRLRRQVRFLRRAGRPGRAVLRLIDGFVAGINGQRRSAKSDVAPWTRTDVIASLSLLGSQFGKGGGHEVANGQFLAALQGRLGAQAGLGVFRDLRQAQDADSPTTLQQPFPYDPVPDGIPAGTVVPDPSVVARAAAGRGTGVAAPIAADEHSNAVLVGGGRTADGHPIAVMGPQVGFFYPAFVMEIGLHGGGFDTRGMTFPGAGFLVLAGRGPGFGWSPTSANVDNVDQFLLPLCEPGGGAPTPASTHYRYRGRCRAMRRVDAGVLGAGAGQPESRVVFRTSVHGPVSGTVTAGGTLYAVATDRSTRDRDILGTLPFERLNRGGVASPQQFVNTMTRLEFTQNWFYLDARHIAMATSGRLPVRAPQTDSSLPTLGSGRYDWRGFLAPARHPQAIDPPSGQILNWNDRVAPGTAAADDEWAWGIADRVGLFTGLKPSGNRVEDVMGVVNRAAQQDLRGAILWPTVARVLAGAAPPDAQAAAAAQRLDAWAAGGALRVDRDGDGRPDDPGAAIMDVLWPKLTAAVLDPVLGDLTDRLRTVAPAGRDPGDDSGSSWFGVGWYSYVVKDLRTQLGEPIRQPYSTRYCGAGDLERCRASLWQAVAQAAAELTAGQGPDPAAWRAAAETQQVPFKPGVLGRTMPWSNRPTFQQVLAFGG